MFEICRVMSSDVQPEISSSNHLKGAEFEAANVSGTFSACKDEMR
jgi:hypothetical protein